MAQPDEQSQRLLSAFKQQANLSTGVSSLHPLDWERFDDFVIDAHTRGLRLTSEDVTEALVTLRVSKDAARNLGSHYHDGRALLKRYDKPRGERQ